MGGTFDIVDAISALPLLNYVGVVDFYDKISFIATCVLLITCSVTVTLREYVMSPISCYMSHSPGGENVLKFMENYCWSQGTMSISDKNFPQNDTEWKSFEKSRIMYYQWVPFMLLFQAALFHTPKMLWTIFTFNMAGTNVRDLIICAYRSTVGDFDANVEILTKHIAYMLEEHREYRNGRLQRFKRKVYQYLPLCVVSKRFANWLAFGYLFTKILYLINSIGQIYLMQTFLHLGQKKGYSSNFGMEITRNIVNGRNWDVTDVFPRVVYCVARVKHLASVNTITAQCVLTANFFIEKIYIVLWFWIVMVSVVTAFSLSVWLLRFLVPSRYEYEIKKNLKLEGSSRTGEHVEEFCKEFLRLDGLFLIHMININAGDLVTTPLVNRLYTLYRSKYKGRMFTKKDTFQYSDQAFESTMLKECAD